VGLSLAGNTWSGQRRSMRESPSKERWPNRTKRACRVNKYRSSLRATARAQRRTRCCEIETACRLPPRGRRRHARPTILLRWRRQRSVAFGTAGWDPGRTSCGNEKKSQKQCPATPNPKEPDFTSITSMPPVAGLKEMAVSASRRRPKNLRLSRMAPHPRGAGPDTSRLPHDPRRQSKWDHINSNAYKSQQNR